MEINFVRSAVMRDYIYIYIYYAGSGFSGAERSRGGVRARNNSRAMFCVAVSGAPSEFKFRPLPTTPALGPVRRPRVNDT